MHTQSLLLLHVAYILLHHWSWPLVFQVFRGIPGGRVSVRGGVVIALSRGPLANWLTACQEVEWYSSVTFVIGTLEHGLVAPPCACLALGNKVYKRDFESCIGVKHVIHVRRGGCHSLTITFRIGDTVSLEPVAVSQQSSQNLHTRLYICGLSCTWFKQRVVLCCSYC